MKRVYPYETSLRPSRNASDKTSLRQKFPPRGDAFRFPFSPFHDEAGDFDLYMILENWPVLARLKACLGNRRHRICSIPGMVLNKDS